MASTFNATTLDLRQRMLVFSVLDTMDTMLDVCGFLRGVLQICELLDEWSYARTWLLFVESVRNL